MPQNLAFHPDVSLQILGKCRARKYEQKPLSILVYPHLQKLGIDSKTLTKTPSWLLPVAEIRFYLSKLKKS